MYYTAGQNGTYNIFSILTDGSGKAERLTQSPDPQQATSWSPGGETLLFHDIDPVNDEDIWAYSKATGKARPVVKALSGQGDATFSPDGRWIAYCSNESGSFEIYVQAYPGPGVKRRVSPDGGMSPFWSHTGHELFYQTATAVFAVPILDARDLRMGAPVHLRDHAGFRSFGRRHHCHAEKPGDRTRDRDELDRRAQGEVGEEVTRRLRWRTASRSVVLTF